MIKKQFTDTNVGAVSATYTYDENVTLKNSRFISRENIELTLFDALCAAEDTSINNYSNINLSTKIQARDIGHVSSQKSTYPDVFTTYLVADTGPGTAIGTTSTFIGIDPTNIRRDVSSQNDISVVFNSFSLSANNENYFEIELINETQCRVYHNDGFNLYYLAYNTSNDNLKFDSAPTGSTHVFNYVIDKDNEYIMLTSEANGIKVITHDTVNETFKGLELGVDIVPPTDKSRIKIRYRPRQDKKIQLTNDWYSYNITTDENTLSASETKSHSDLYNNFLFNTQYENITDGKLPINFTPLKNQLTSEYDQSRNNPFPGNSEVELREYNSLFTGTNQIEGADKISLGFESFTRKLTLKPDTLTYFHMPQDIYPYSRINIADAGLTEAGAIGSTTPLRADKIFKKSGNYKTSSNFGDSTNEQSGEFLCAWLLYNKTTDQYFWVDRYYDPKKLSYFEALRSTGPVTYTTDFTTEDNAINSNNESIYDKLSTLTLEPGVLYAYHRVGSNDVQNIVDRIPYLLQDGIESYSDKSGSSIEVEENIYNFDGERFGSTTPATNIEHSSNFTINFDMYSDDWSKPFGYQIFGNYVNKGFGIFNKRAVTPFVTIPDREATYILNSDFELLNTIPVSSETVLRQDALDNIHLVNDKEQKILTYDLRGNKIKELNITTGAALDSTVSTSVLGNYVYITDPNRLGTVFVYPLSGTETTDGYIIGGRNVHILGTSIDEQAEIPVATGFGGNPTSGATSVVATSHNVAYVGKAHNKDVDIYGNIWKSFTASHGGNYVVKTDLDPATDENATFIALSSNGNRSIEKVKTDIRGDAWIIHDNSHLAKVSNNRDVIFSKPLSAISPSLSGVPLSGAKALDFIREFDNGELNEYCIVLNQEYTTTARLSSDTTCYFFNMSGGFVKSKKLDINLTSPVSSNSVNGFTNYDYVKRLYSGEVNKNELIFKIKQGNPNNTEEFDVIEFKVDATQLSPGYHNFIYNVNSDETSYTLKINDVETNNSSVSKNLYRLDDTITRRFNVGSASFYDGNRLQDTLEQPGRYLGTNFKLKNVKVYNDALRYFDTKFLYRLGKEIQPIEWHIPGGGRQYIETIDRFFKHRLPGHKTNFYETVVTTNDALTAENLLQDYQSYIKSELSNYVPINNELDRSTWLHTLCDGRL